jgi:hypothetical protein
VPVTFELMVLCAGVSTVAAFIWRSGLRPGRRSPLADLGVTDDRFAIVLRNPDGTADTGAAEALVSRFHPVTIVGRDAL